MNISFGITVKDEFEVFNLIKYISCFLKEGDQIVTLRDSDKPHIHDELIKQEYPWVRSYYRPLNNNFAEQKNWLINLCEHGELVMLLDADELPSYELMRNIHEIPNIYRGADAFAFPRINIYAGLQKTDATDLGLDDQNRFHFPDYQRRFFKNKRNILYSGELHETLRGYSYCYDIPYSSKCFLIHCKTVERQCEGNKLYSEINPNETYGLGRMRYSKGKNI